MAFLGNRILNRYAPKDPVTGAIIPYTITRQTPPVGGQSYDAQGNFQGTAQTGTTTFPVVASVQPLRGRDREFLPEGMREKEVVCIEADTQLNTADQVTQTIGDRFQWNNRTWEVGHREVPDGSFMMDINHWEGYAFLVPVDTQVPPT